ncbi:hypothetical protein [Asticcacaulis benevestitus]|uniref:Uncharacterized protein n=1 Tax=Asticcacaulis benevestitus DSM 16100 = ATCC BAA-896 TaxID=1121022 RepID=V4P386_9CAUL|nr:hypothetical protein [Asticcacaulis benevestitus]ESQ81604.1 hypothetical protein ABENE_21775 [Asticcacaulis benevestitus DSM 16100 = ATCC BAA-896]
MQHLTQKTHPRPDLRLVAARALRWPLAHVAPGFSRRELQRLVADMID